MENILFPKLQETVATLSFETISSERKEKLQPLIQYIQSKHSENKTSNLHFICTHNSRRSQLAQVLGQAAGFYYNIPTQCFSGGVEVTAFYESAVVALQEMGFVIEKKGDENARYHITFSEKAEPLVAFSKVFDAEENPTSEFAAVMTCSDADTNCPFIPGAEKRISLPYEDPKTFDGTPKAKEMYSERAKQIATELFYVFSKITS